MWAPLWGPNEVECAVPIPSDQLWLRGTPTVPPHDPITLHNVTECGPSLRAVHKLLEEPPRGLDVSLLALKDGPAAVRYDAHCPA